MKRITVALLGALLALGSASAAMADGIDIKVRGQWDSGLYDYVFAARDGGPRHDNSVTAQNSTTQAFWLGTHLELTAFSPPGLQL